MVPSVAGVVPVVLGAVGAGFLVRFLLGGGNDSDLMSSTAFMITAVPFVLAWLEAPGRLLHPLALLGFTMLIGVAGQTAYLSYLSNQQEVVDPSSPLFRRLAGLPLDILAPGLLVTCIALVALALGYLLAPAWSGSSGNRTPRIGRALRFGMRQGLAVPAPRPTVWTIVLLSTMSVVAFAIFAPKVGITTIDSLLTSEKRFADIAGEGQWTSLGYLRWGMSLAGVAFILGTYAIARHGMRWRSTLGVVTLVALALAAAYSLVTSSRTALFAVVAIAALTAVAVRQREPRPAILTAATLSALIVLASLLGLRGYEQGRASAAVSPASWAAQIFGAGDWMDIGPLSVIVAKVPESYEYAYGTTVLSVLWAPVPRTLWPDKPPVRIGPELGQRVFGFDPDRRSGDPPGLIGEMWVNGGIVGVLIGAFILGWLLRWVARLYHTSPASQGLSALPYGLMMVSLALILPTGDVTGTVLFVIQYASALALGLWLIGCRGGHTATLGSS